MKQDTQTHFRHFAKYVHDFDSELANALGSLCTLRGEFSRHLAIDKRDFVAIEYLLRKGRRQLDVYSSPGIKDIIV
jgi:hypothetical protein